MNSYPRIAAARCSSRLQTRLILLTMIVCLAMSCVAKDAIAAAARFWISMSNQASPVPEVPVLQHGNGKVSMLHIWGRPATGETLQNLSLNLWVNPQNSQAVIDFLDSGIVVHNPIVGLVNRFELVHDSTSTPTLTSNKSSTLVAGGAFDGIGVEKNPVKQGLQGFTINGGSGAGIADSGAPRLIASVPFKSVLGAGQNSGTAHIHLQIGYSGMNNFGEPVSAFSTFFGTDTNSAFDYTGAIADRETTIIGASPSLSDTPDLILNVISSPPGDYSRNGIVDAADYTVWRDTLGQSGMGLDADGNGNSQIDTGDYSYWKTRFGQSGGSSATSATSIPEPSVAAFIVFALCGSCFGRCRMNLSTRNPAAKCGRGRCP